MNYFTRYVIRIVRSTIIILNGIISLVNNVLKDVQDV